MVFQPFEITSVITLIRIRRMKAIEKPQVIITTSLFILLAIIILMLMTAGCVSDSIEGNRDPVAQERPTQSFTDVVAQGSFTVFIVADTVNRVIVKCESNILPYLYTTTNGSTITIGYKSGYAIHEHNPVEVYLHMPVLHSAKLAGSGRVECSSLITNAVSLNLSGSGTITGDFIAVTLNAEISGSGNMELTGTAGTSQLTISGSGDIDAQDLAIEHCSADISGSGNIIAGVNKTLDAAISGSGNIFYHGNPAIASHITGSGKVERY